jgi:single-strand DNA-binding protein
MSVNVAILRGTCSSEPVVRVLESGTVLAQLQITTRPDDGLALSVPVSVWEPPAWVETLAPGNEVVVVGRVRRRFYRAGGATGSRVEIEAEHVAPAGDRRRVQAARRRADAAVASLADPSR